MSGKFVRNTVPGTRRGSKWPPEVRAACLADVLVERNVNRAAQRNGVPESTIRGWCAELGGLGGAGWDAVIAETLRKVADKAARHSVMAVDMMGGRMRQSKKQAARREEIVNRVVGADGKRRPGKKQKEQLMEEYMLQRPLADATLANFARTLVQVSAKVAGPGESGEGEGGALSDADRALLEKLAQRVGVQAEGEG